MRKQDILVTIALVIFPFLMVSLAINSKAEEHASRPHVSLIKPVENKTDVSGAISLFVGDSHTANPRGWQDRLCKKTGMTYKNVSISGKSTPWMVETLKKTLTEKYDFVFIYGGANDVCNGQPLKKPLTNIKRMVAHAQSLGVTPIVIAGFVPERCVNKTSPCGETYPARYAQFQQMLKDSLSVSVIQFEGVQKKDCADAICHMTASGHEKASEDIISHLHLERMNGVLIQKSRP